MTTWIKITLFLLLPAFAIGQGSVNVNSTDDVFIVRDFEYFVDTNRVANGEVMEDAPFISIKEGKTTDLQNVYDTWIRFDLNVSTLNEESIVLLVDQANIDTIDFFQKDENGTWVMTRLGNDTPFNNRTYKVNHFIFDVLPSAQNTTVYARVKNNVKISYNFMVGEQNRVLQREYDGNIFFAIVIGIMFVMIAYNLFIWISVKEEVYLIYVIQSLVSAVLQATLYGFSFQYFWPNTPMLNDFSSEILTILGSITGLMFMTLFLRTKEHVPVLHKITWVFYSVYAFLLIMVGVDVRIAHDLLLAVQALVAIFILIVAIGVMLKGYEPAKFYLLAWSVFLLGIVIFVLSQVGIIERNYFTTLTVSFGAAIELVLLSLALANRINVLKIAREKAVGHTLQLEKEKALMVREQNQQLEKKVRQRTNELEQSNAMLAEKNTELANAYDDIKNAQSQLVNAEKMSSLGQLTAGIAHEINNPINFVSSNINPLKRDIEDVVAIFEETEKLVSQWLTDEQKQEIEGIKEEYDYGYVKDEITQLLSGMEDGAYRTVEIIRGLKLFSRVDEDDLKKVNLEEGITSTLILLNSQFKHAIKVTKNFGEIPMVECYGGKMNQVFMNILSNAGQALLQNPEREDNEITITTSANAEQVQLTFADNGPGMTAETKEKLFEPFFTTKPVGEGTGLGLSIVYKIIENLNGTISVNSELGKGTEFIITLPITNTTKQPTNE